MKPIILFFIFLLVATGLAAQDKIKSIEGGLGAISSFRKLRDDGSFPAQSMIRTRNVKEHPIPSWGAFVNYRRQLTHRFTINGGLAYERLGYGEEFAVRFSDQDFPSGGSVPSGLPYEIKYRSIYHVARIPFTIEYYFSKRKRFEWYVKAGFSLDLMINNYVIKRTYYTGGSLKTTRIPEAGFNARTITLSHAGGIGGDYKLNDKACIRFNLMYSQNLLAFNTDPVRLHLQWVALNVGYNYRIN